MSQNVTLGLLVLAAFALLPAANVAQHPRPLTAPEAFTSQIEARTAVSGAATYIRIQIDRYTADHDRTAMEDALTHGGYPSFLIALRKAPAVGHVELGGEKFTVRWAREKPTPKGGRAITVVTDAPVYFVGGGRTDAKPRTGFELAVVELAVDEFGIGLGKMAAAARVKPDGSGGVVLEDYAEQPIKLTLVRRESK
jgi:hypothetical protein